MQLRTLGKTGLQISPLGYGAAGVDFGRAEAGKLLNIALDEGLSVIDTAECYQSSEDIIGEAVGHRRAQFSIFTKFGHQSGLAFDDWDPRLVMPSIERSLKRLRTDRVELLQIHTPPHARLIDGSLIEPLKAAQKAGKCRFIGFSGDAESARWAVRSGHFDVLQTSISIADQEAIATAAEAQAKGMGVLAKRPVANGHWSNPPTTPANDFADYRRRLQLLAYPFLKDVNPGAIALRFTLSVPGVSTALAHTKKIERWRENAAAAAKGPLSVAEFKAIRDRWHQVATADWTGQT